MVLQTQEHLCVSQQWLVEGLKLEQVDGGSQVVQFPGYVTFLE